MFTEVVHNVSKEHSNAVIEEIIGQYLIYQERKLIYKTNYVFK